MPLVGGFTQSNTVTTSPPTQITAQSNCKQITIGEDPGVVNYPTTDYYIYKPAASGPTPRRVQSGGTYTFVSTGLFTPGQAVGFVATFTGTTTFFQDEQ
jgi:hypothetical protein